MEEIIGEWKFDFSKPIFMEHPNFKFWEVTINDRSVKFRVGKMKDGVENQTEDVSKDYSTISQARTTVITKINEKLTKGYHPRDAVANIAEKPTKRNVRAEPKKEEKQRNFSGQYYEKGDEACRLQINGKKVKITRIDKGREKFEIRSFDSHEEAVDFCDQEEAWLLGEGYHTDNSKFMYSFVDDQPASKATTKRETKKKTNNLLSVDSAVGSGDRGANSITKMTDDVMSNRSRVNSDAKSDRSYMDDDDEENDYVPSRLGNPTSGCIKVLLAETWSEDVDPTGWIMSEKLDGVRCFWTGTTMYSRNANRFFFPKFFTKGWPKSQLDGELFIDRGKFSQTLSAVRKNVPIESEWRNVKYLVFDCPGVKKPFKERLALMDKVIKEINSPYLKCHAHRVCKSLDDLIQELDQVNKVQGEGLMLRQPQSLYENRRSKSLLKVKTFHDDEAQVIGYKPGTGRCHGMVGALKCRNSHGVQFEVGSGMTDEIRRHPPKIGTKITYKYQEFNKDSGKPRFPTYMRGFDKI